MNAFYDRLWWSVRPLFVWRLLRLLLRGFWLAAGLVVGGRLLSAWLGWPIEAAAWTLFGALAWLALFIVLALWPISSPRLARRVDRALGLRDQVSTGLEIARRGPRNYMERQLLENAAGLLNQANRRFRRMPAVPWIDLEMCALVLAALYALSVTPALFTPPIVFGGDSALPPVAAEPPVPLPGLPPQITGGLSPFGEPEAGAGSGGALDPLAAQEALDALTGALGSQTITAPAGSALAQGDIPGAAQELRELADAAGSISPEAQQQLGQSLREAAADVQDSAPQAAQTMLESAQALQSQNPAEAASGLEGLAQLVEDLGAARESGALGEPGSGVGSNAGREQSGGGSLDRLPSDGEALQLPEGDDPAEEGGVLLPPDGRQTPDGQRSTPYTEVGGAGGAVGQISDPLAFPWRLRGVVQRYFSAP